MNIPDYKNRGSRATDLFSATGIYFAGRGGLNLFLILIAPPSKNGNDPTSFLFAICLLVFGILLLKVASNLSPKGIYRTGSDNDWSHCIERVFDNAKAVNGVEKFDVPAVSKKAVSQEIDIKYHW